MMVPLKSYKVVHERVNKLLIYNRFSYHIIDEDVVRYSSEVFLLKKVRKLAVWVPLSDGISSEYDAWAPTTDKVVVKKDLL